MLSEEFLKSRTKIEAKEITMVYGIDKPPEKAKTGVPLAKANEAVTDVQKAYFAAHWPVTAQASSGPSIRSTKPTRSPSAKSARKT